MAPIQLLINNSPHEVEVAPDTPLLWVLRDKLNMTEDYDWVDEHNPGPAHDPNLRRGVRGLKPVQAPYYPDTGETGYPATEPPTLQGTCDSSKEVIDGPTTRAPQFSRARR